VYKRQEHCDTTVEKFDSTVDHWDITI
jgi:hypothetical protein